jgi:hypothetical protein
MAQSKDALLQAIERLERALAEEPAGRQQAWAREADQALAAAEQALGQESAEAGSPGGLFKAVDMTRPALVRRVDELRRLLSQEVGEAHELRDQVKEAAGTVAPDLATLRRHLQEFALTLRRLKEGEIDVVQESVTTDLGAGD